MNRNLALLFLFAYTELVSASPKIVGGIDAPNGAYPHQVALSKQNGYSCGGSIIHNEWVVTAANCVYGFPASSLSITAGTNRMSTGGTKHGVITFYIHPKYNPDTYENNVAILRVQHITFNVNTNKIALERSSSSDNTPLTVTGWGFTSSPPSGYPDKLQQLSVTTINSKACSEELGRTIPSTEFCTYTKIGEGTCAGDTGGPLVNAFKRLVGIAQAFNYPCGGGRPDVHTDASAYHEWFNGVCNCL